MGIMKAITWLASCSVGFAVVSSAAIAAPHEGWSADLDKAIAQAKKENKAVLVEFTGSDWCPPCMMMRKEVFSKKEFVEKASKQYILVEIDLPKKDKAVAEKNRPLVEKYKVDGFPTIMLLDKDGKEFARFYASEHPSIEAFLGRINKELERKDLD